MIALTCLLGLALAPVSVSSDVRVVGEALDGSVREFTLGSLSLTDPRDLGLVLLRFEGLEPWRGQRIEDEILSLELANGDRLQGRVVGGQGEVLSLELIGGVVLPIDISSFRSLVFPARLPSGFATTIGPAPQGDRVYRLTSSSVDVDDGTVLRFSDSGIGFESESIGKRVFGWGEVAALFVEVLEETPSAAETEGVAVVLDLVDASRVRGRMRSLNASGLTLLLADTEVLLPLETIAEIAVDDGSIAFLSDMPVVSEEGLGAPFDDGDDGPAIGMVWPHRVDRASTGARLTAGGRVWTRGIGAHAPSRLTWQLDGSWSELRGRVAIDDSTKKVQAEGSVVFRIHVDDELAWESGVIRGGDPPVPFPPIALRGKRKLVLEADMATRSFQGDRADWLRLVLVR
ncbi:MAG: NPCBM/NEW2 domain-containing protein [Planctomycetota bacterium]|nr:NPCBM/NEW2 domain-containing protein [Planctomycetota bacterium]